MRVRRVGAQSPVCGVHRSNGQADEANANARLIAAAPDLLDACRAAADALAYCVEPATGCDDERHIADALASLEAAIAKAEQP